MLHDEIAQAYATLPGWAQTLAAIAITLLIGLIAVRITTALILRALDRDKLLDPTVRTFLGKLANAAGYVLLTIIILRILGIDLAALLGGLAVGGFIVGFALKDTLGNLAAGFVLLIYRPFNVGDNVEIAPHNGTVLELGISLTTIRRGDGVIITIPNGTILGGPIVNYTRATTRRTQHTIRIRPTDDIPSATRAIHDALRTDPRILRDPQPEIIVTATNENGIHLETRAWTQNADHGTGNNHLPTTIKQAIEQAGCKLANPQHDIHLHTTT